MGYNTPCYLLNETNPYKCAYMQTAKSINFSKYKKFILKYTMSRLSGQYGNPCTIAIGDCLNTYSYERLGYSIPLGSNLTYEADISEINTTAPLTIMLSQNYNTHGGDTAKNADNLYIMDSLLGQSTALYVYEIQLISN